MARLRYADAVKLLGGATPEVKAMDNLFGGLLSVATAGGSDAALSLFDAKAEMIRLGHAAVGALGDRVLGRARYDRSRLLVAAHGVLVVTAFFEAFDELVAVDAAFTREEQIALVAGTPATGSWLRDLLDARLPAPAAEHSHAELLSQVRQWYQRSADRSLAFLTGLRVWERATEKEQRAARARIEQELPDRALRRFEEATLRLAAETPEFALWTQRADAQARHGRSLAVLEELLTRVTAGQDPQRLRAGLAAAYRDGLRQAVIADTDDLATPTLAEHYVDPLFRLKPAGSGAHPAAEDWWADAPQRADLSSFLAAWLTQPQAAEAPLLLVAEPGGGKSSLTRVLAARLPAADYLVVRVPLREVSTEDDLQDQIERAVRNTVGEETTWPDLVRTAAGAMPVLLLDGLDELLQTSGAEQADYLTRAAEFQRREAVQGRPVAVVITTRVAVADRAVVPDRSLVMRLDAFDDERITRWLDVWNAADPLRRPLTLASVKQFPQLTEQPLLLLMLAVYEAEEPTGTAGMETAELYERLLRRFAEREVRRLHPARRNHGPLVEAELERLSTVALAMFNRSRQWVTEQEVNDDLAALGLTGEAEALVGRFYFLQSTPAAYEFLHATFGEFLVARGLARALHEGAPIRHLISFVPLVARGTVIDFVAWLIEPAARPRLLAELGVAVTRPSADEHAYRPVDLRVDHAMATYSFNLLLLTLACGGPVRAAALFPDATDPALEMRRAAARWMAATDGVTWGNFLDTVAVRRCWTGDRRDIELTFGGGTTAEPVDTDWTLTHPMPPPPGGSLARHTSQRHVFESLNLTGGIGDDLLRHALEPLTSRMPEALTTLVVHRGRGTESILRSLLYLWTTSAGGRRGEQLALAYDRAVGAITTGEREDFTTGVELISRLLVGDAHALDPELVGDWLATMVRHESYEIGLAPAILECVLAAPRLDDRAVADIVQAALIPQNRVGGAEVWTPLERIRLLVAGARIPHSLGLGLESWLRVDLAPHVAGLLTDPELRAEVQANPDLHHRVEAVLADYGQATNAATDQ